MIVVYLHYAFLIAALVSFLLEVLGVVSRVNLIALGLAFLTAAFLT